MGGKRKVFGSTGYVQTNLISEIQEAENATIMGWFNTNVTVGGQQHIFWIGDVAGNGWGAQQEINVTINHFHADLQSSNLCLFYGSSADTGPNNVNIVSSDAVFNPGEWHHIAAVIKYMSGEGDDPTEAELYLDGVLLTPYDWSTTSYGYANSNVAGGIIDRYSWNTALRIGIGGSLTRAYNGYMDEVKIFDSALTAEQIQAAMIPASIDGIDSEDQCLVYPNPVKDMLYIKNGVDVKFVEIFDMMGKRALSTPVKSAINVGSLQGGVYFVKLYGENDPIVQKMVKQ